MSNTVSSLEEFLAQVARRDGNQPEFLQAVQCANIRYGYEETAGLI